MHTHAPVPASRPAPGGASSSRRFIRELGPAERLEGAFAIANAQLGKTKQDKPFLKCLIGDKTGMLPGRMWSIEPHHFRRLPTDGFVYIEAETQPYQGELQLIIHLIDPIEPAEDQLRELLPCSDQDPETMLAEVRAILATLQHPAARALAEAYLADEHLMSALKRCPAAKSMHHACLGGLLEHTLQVMRLATAVCPLYPRLSRDLVVLGLFLHDLGKTRELVYDRTFSYSDRGELIGHITDGVIMLHDKAQQVMRATGVRLPANLVMVLQHIILSHHGLPEFGAAKVPSTPEAIMVSLLDNLDAKTEICLSAARCELGTSALGGNFTEKHWALDAKLFRPDPLKE
ncbi:MAG TPA: HD domain-containing protein [Phycisphaerales bacterium]|nr:HD domain-containing protein [Phycisphaerales bacterium]